MNATRTNTALGFRKRKVARRHSLSLSDVRRRRELESKRRRQKSETTLGRRRVSKSAARRRKRVGLLGVNDRQNILAREYQEDVRKGEGFHPAPDKVEYFQNTVREIKRVHATNDNKYKRNIFASKALIKRLLSQVIYDRLRVGTASPPLVANITISKESISMLQILSEKLIESVLWKSGMVAIQAGKSRITDSNINTVISLENLDRNERHLFVENFGSYVNRDRGQGGGGGPPVDIYGRFMSGNQEFVVGEEGQGGGYFNPEEEQQFYYEPEFASGGSRGSARQQEEALLLSAGRRTGLSSSSSRRSATGGAVVGIPMFDEQGLVYSPPSSRSKSRSSRLTSSSKRRRTTKVGRVSPTTSSRKSSKSKRRQSISGSGRRFSSSRGDDSLGLLNAVIGSPTFNPALDEWELELLPEEMRGGNVYRAEGDEY